MPSRQETKAKQAEGLARRKARKAAVEAAVREHGGKIPDPDIAAMVGVGENTIWRARTRLGIEKYRLYGDTEAKRAIVWKRYMQDGAPAAVVGAEMGLTERMVRKIAQGAGWKRDREVWLKNSRAAQGKSALTRIETWKEKRAKAQAEKVEELASRGIVLAPQLTDAELIAKALEEGRVTVLPPGQACGTTRWEAALHTAYPVAVFTTQAQRASAAKLREKKLRVEAAVREPAQSVGEAA